MLAVFSITFPVFFIVLLGYAFSRFEMFELSAQKTLSFFVFYCAMPCYLFLAMQKSSVDMFSNINYISSFALALAVVAFFSWLLSWKLFNNGHKESVLAMMAGCYTNSAFIGIPIIVMAFGELGPVVIVTLFQLVFVTTFILTTIELLQRNTSFSVGMLFQIPRTIAFNPIIGGALSGIIFSIFDWKIPAEIEKGLDLLGGAGIPTALFALGLSLGQKTDLRSYNKALVYVLVFIKTIIHPLIAGGIGYFIFHLPNAWLGALVVVSAMPTAMNNFIYAQRYGAFQAESSKVIFLSSILSLFTISIILWWFQQ